VPVFKFERHRTLLTAFSNIKEAWEGVDIPPNAPSPAKGLKGYWATKNVKSIDGLPGLLEAFKSPLKFQSRNVVPEKKSESSGLNVRLDSMVRGTNGWFDVKSFLSFLAGIVFAALYFRWAGSV
jgi:hypothetical protein